MGDGFGEAIGLLRSFLDDRRKHLSEVQKRREKPYVAVLDGIDPLEEALALAIRNLGATPVAREMLLASEGIALISAQKEILSRVNAVKVVGSEAAIDAGAAVTKALNQEPAIRETIAKNADVEAILDYDVNLELARSDLTRAGDAFLTIARRELGYNK